MRASHLPQHARVASLRLPRQYTYPFLLLQVFRLESRGHHDNLGSQVNRSNNLNSLSIKGSAQMRVVREHLPNIILTLTRESQHRRSCSLTRVWMFFHFFDD